MKKLFSMIEIHPLTLIYYLFALFTGYFKWYWIAMVIVLIHEYHHTIIACFFHFKVNKITLYPFGAFVWIEDYGKHPIYQEALMLLAGLCSHFTIYVFIEFLYPSFLSQVTYAYALKMNQMILCFNLLPIWPMDGSKLLELVLFHVLDYNKAVILNLFLSVFLFCFFLMYHFKMNYMVISLFLMYQLYQAFKERKYRYILYLLSHDTFKKRIKIYHHKLRFYRPYTNYLMYNGRLLAEDEMKRLALKTVDKNKHFF